MPGTEDHLSRWQSAGAPQPEVAPEAAAEAAARMRALESQAAAQSPTEPPPGLRWLGVTALSLAAILIACGVILFFSSHWDQFSPGARYALAIALVALFHMAGGLTRSSFRALSVALHAVGTIAAGAAIRLVGEIFSLQYHWPNIIFLWALAALAGWLLLRDQAQQTLALLLIPAWIFCELGFRTGGYIGDSVYIGRLCFVWGVLYLTFFLGSEHKAVKGILFAAGAIAAAVGVVQMLSGWVSFAAWQSFIPFGTCVWTWVAIALPFMIAAFHGHKGLIPIAAAIAFSAALPWCYSTSIDTYSYRGGPMIAHVETSPSLLAHVLVAAFAVFLCWWGVRLGSRALVNLGIAGFAAAVVWFYFSDIFSDKNRALGLIGLGVLFLAGGWGLEIARRRILTAMNPAKLSEPQTAAARTPTQNTAQSANGGSQ